MKTILKNIVSGEEVEVSATCEHPASSYGHPVWVDANNQAYCEVGKEEPFYKVLNRMPARYSIGRQLAEIRKERGLTVRQLAELCGIGYASISRLENGNYNASIDILTKICEALDADIQVIARDIKK